MKRLMLVVLAALFLSAASISLAQEGGAAGGEPAGTSSGTATKKSKKKHGKKHKKGTKTPSQAEGSK
jgi:hypothetical protein